MCLRTPDRARRAENDKASHCVTDIYCVGTEEEWNAIRKLSDWDYQIRQYTVHYNY